MTKSNKPDNARDVDADFDIPTYDPKKDGAKAGRDLTSRGTASRGTASRVSRVSQDVDAEQPETEVLSASRPTERTAETTAARTAPSSDEERAQQAEEPVKPKRSSVLDRAGRAEPQTIAPRGTTAGEPEYRESESRGAEYRGTEDVTDDVDVDADTRTTAFPRPAVQRDSEPEETVALNRDVDADAEYDYADQPHTELIGAGTAGAATEMSPEATSGVAAADSDDALRVDEDALDDDRTRDGRRGTIDFGLLLARLALGLFLICSGAAAFFNLGNSGGLTELESEFAAYPHANIWAIAIPALELFAGVFLVLGLVFPFAAMVAVAVTGFSALHAISTGGVGFDVFSWTADIWLPVVLFALSLAVQFTGPGVASLDFGRSWARRPLASSWVFAILGIAAAAGAAFFAGIF